jgi:drug/metabolite transporter (DMT)-like permease
MQNLILGRRPYWLLVAALIVLKVGVVMVIMFAPQASSFLRYVDTAIIIVLAMVVGARFADVGWPRWLGVVLVLVIAIVLPIALIFASPMISTRPKNPLDVVPDLAWIATIMQLTLLIVAGVKKSTSGLDEGMGGKAEQGGRKEPTFP